MLRSVSVAIVIAVVGLTIVGGAAAQGRRAQPAEDDPAGYKQAIGTAISEFDRNNYAEAREHFARAHALHPNARTLRGMGMTEFELKNYVEATHCPSGVCGGGHCVDGLANWSCDCNEGFAGTGTKACSAALYCPKDACTPGGTCVDSMNWSCQCGTGFTGSGTRACTNPSDCPTDRCRGPNGTCADLVGTYRCDCNSGFSGPDCSNDICSPNPCRNGGHMQSHGNAVQLPAGLQRTQLSGRCLQSQPLSEWRNVRSQCSGCELHVSS